jgi:type IV pilus assembly protein PilB
MAKRKRLGEILHERGQVSVNDLSKALQDQKGKVIHLGELLLQRNLVSKKDIVAALGEVTTVPYVDATKLQALPKEVLSAIPAAMAKRCNVLPIGNEAGRLLVLMAEPQNVQVIDELRFKTGKEIEPRFGFHGEIRAVLERYYPEPQDTGSQSQFSQEFGDGTMEFISSSEQQRNIEAMREIQAELLQKSKTTPAVQVVASTIQAAVRKSASDIHIEPQAGETSIRLRIDGILREHQQIPKALQNSVASRVKILADMDISERRAPQDGRFLVRTAGRRIDLRVSTLPTQYGEKVVMRLLESEAPLRGFEILGFPAAVSVELKKMLGLPQGMILVTGPTGSGKSTTLYGALSYVKKPSINIITVEDPVEYMVPGLNQVQVNVKAGLTFASSLRSILRQDPNVIMVGEIRDKETAEIAIKAAQTGHLVLSTLHTNDSVGAVTRLADIGIPGYQIASAVTGIVAQRLVRRLCACHGRVAPTPEFLSQMALMGVDTMPTTQTIVAGCDQCDFTGYKGRIGIYEILIFNGAIRGAVRQNGRNDEVRSIARRNGMRLMHEYALEHVLAGLTTLDEVQRVVPVERAGPAKCESCQQELVGTYQFCPHCGKKTSGSGTREVGQEKPEEQGVVH